MVHNENGYFPGDVPTKAEKEHEGKKLLVNNIRNAIEVQHGKRDGIDVAKVNYLDIYLCTNMQIKAYRSMVNYSWEGAL